MPANQRQQTAQSPTSPTTKASAKYTNKDGSKYITIPKGQGNIESSEASPAMPPTTKLNGQAIASTDANGGTAVNRKKQKRREKEAAKRLAQGQLDSQLNSLQKDLAQSATEIKKQMQDLEARFREHGLKESYQQNEDFDPNEGEPYYSDEAESGSYGPGGSPARGYGAQTTNAGKKSKSKKKSRSTQPDHDQVHGTNGLPHAHVSLPLPPLRSTNLPRGPGISKEKIWNTSSQEERERIKEFWLSLGEDERKSLVKVEKDAVLKKMKEQQKHSCSCTVCGRKRTAIEEELEVLYDAYYEELEQYANHQGDGPPLMPPPRRFGAVSGLQPPNRLPPAFSNQQPSRGRIVEQLGDEEEEEEEEEEGEEEYSEDDGEEEEYSDDEPEELPRSHATDFFNFGNSLTVQGGILTVADDLLKNDGKKFIEMMEQLAERRMAREEDAREQFSNQNYGHPTNGAMHTHSHNHTHTHTHAHTHTHNHPPPPDDEEYDDEDEDEDEFDSQDEDYDEEEMDTMTEEQRMEEGRRMFQIFAARMFEQRVLTAYKKKVSEERTQRLLEELDEENKAQSQKAAKKARDAQKKKEKLAQKKQQVAEEKLKREAEEAEKLAAVRAAEEKKVEEQRLKAEEKRKKKEAQKKAEEEERLRKEADKQRRLQEQRERQAEQERRQREAKDKERKEKEEQRQREKDAKEAKEREAKDRREKQDREKRESDLKIKAEREAKESQKREEALAAQKAAAQAAFLVAQSKRPPVPTLANLQPVTVASPHIPIATPAIPKAPTPVKLRASSSQQDSNSSVPQTPQTTGISQTVSPVPSTPILGSPGVVGPAGKKENQMPFLHQPQASSPIHAALKGPPGMPPQPSPFGGLQSMGGMNFPPGMPMMGPGYGGRIPQDSMFPPVMGAPFRPLMGPNGMPMPMNMHQMPQGRGFPMQHGPPPGFTQHIPNGLAIGQTFGGPKEGQAPVHSRQQSASFEPPGGSSAQPIARPAPIGRPHSVVHDQHHDQSGSQDLEDLSNHLGSSALLDDSDEPLGLGAGARRSSAAPRQSFPPPFGMEPATFGNPIPGFGNWGAPPNPFGASSLPGSNYMGGGWPAGSSFGPGQSMRPSQPRSISVRLMICRSCKNLEGSTPDGFYDINAIKDQLDQMNPGEPVTERELLDICETEGNAVNGGGSFNIRNDGNGRFSIRHEADLPSSHRPPVGAPGEIGSPIMGNGGMARFAGPPGF